MHTFGGLHLVRSVVGKDDTVGNPVHGCQVFQCSRMNTTFDLGDHSRPA